MSLFPGMGFDLLQQALICGRFYLVAINLGGAGFPACAGAKLQGGKAQRTPALKDGGQGRSPHLFMVLREPRAHKRLL
jgi:hypothetical protein